MAPKKFSVVRFLKENSVDFIPSTWLSDQKTKCSYPKFQPPNFIELKRDASYIPPPSWPKYKIAFIKSYDTAELAESKADKYLISSDLEESEREESNSTHYPFFNEDGNSDGQTKEPILGLVNSETPHVNLQPPGNFFGLTDSVEGAFLEPRATTTVNILPSTCQSASGSNSATGANAVFSQEVFPITHDQHTYVLTPQQASAPNCCNNSDLLLKILENQKVIQQQLSDIKTTQIQTLSRLSTAPQSDLTSMPPVPISSPSSLNEVESWLQIPNNFNHLVAALSKLGGHEVSLCTYSILNYIFLHQFALEVRLTNATGKIAIGSSKVVEVVREAVRASFPNATNKTIDKNIGAWFRTSSDRKGGRAKRQRSSNPKENDTTSGEAGSAGDREQAAA